jgi:aryl-alcohol dehydrogenase-like predicted oxidoreductase
MTWGEAHGLARFQPANLDYGGAHGYDEEKAALETSLAAGVTLFDTAAMYSSGASERRLGELARDTEAILATKFPSGFLARAESMPRDLDASITRLGRVDLYQHHFPSGRVSIPRLMDLMADAVEAGKIKAVGVSNYSRGTDAHRPWRVSQTWCSARLEPGRVLAPAPPARSERSARCLL